MNTITANKELKNIILCIQSNIHFEKVRNWDREAHQKETHLNEWVFIYSSKKI